MSVRVEFEPTETWLLDERLEPLLEVVRFETDRIAVSKSDGEALLESTEAPGTYGHIAVLHGRDSIAGASTPADVDGSGIEAGGGRVRASFQHDSSPRTYTVRKALEPYRQVTLEH